MAPDVPADWAAAVRRILGGGIRRVLVLGGTDAGKSSFCRVLLREAARMRRAAELLDADPGQKIVGPPACATLVRGLSSMPTALAFVGVLDPLRGWHRLVDGSARLVAEASDHALLVVNTSGLLAGAGRRLKAAKIAAVQPQLLVGLGRDPELDAILADHTAIPAVRLGRSPSARRKSEGERRALRHAAFHAYLAPAPVWALDLRGLWQEAGRAAATRAAPTVTPHASRTKTTATPRASPVHRRIPIALAFPGAEVSATKPIPTTMPSKARSTAVPRSIRSAQERVAECPGVPFEAVYHCG